MTDNTEKVDAVEKVPSIENQFGTEEVYNGKNEVVGYAPTEEELATLRTVSDRLPLAAWSVAIVELGERFTY